MMTATRKQTQMSSANARAHSVFIISAGEVKCVRCYAMYWLAINASGCLRCLPVPLGSLSCTECSGCSVDINRIAFDAS